MTTIIQCEKCGRMTGNYVELPDETVVCERCNAALEAWAFSLTD